MAVFLYVNGTSIFDYSNGACASLLNIFEGITKAGHKAYVVTGCSSTSITSYEFSKSIWENNRSKHKGILYRFIHEGVYHSLVKTTDWQRNSLTSFEQETIFREALSILDNTNVNYVIGWGNLLLEESIFKEAKAREIKLIFYLVNKFYKGSNTFILKNCDAVLTDSEATKSLYKNDLDCNCTVLPKFINEPKEYQPEKFLSSNDCLFINPSLEKGLEAFLLIAEYLSEKNSKINFICRDAKGLLRKELKMLNKEFKDMPSNIQVKNGTNNKENLFKGIKVLLVLSIRHESGTSLIYEAYCRGIPVIAFDVGGNAELIGNYKENLFFKPETIEDINSNLKIKNWNPTRVSERISSIINNYDNYINYSNEIKKNFEKLHLKKKSIDIFNKFVEEI